MLTPERIAELEKVVAKVSKAYKARKADREEDRIYDEQGPHGLAMHAIGRDVAATKAKEAEIAQSKRRLEAQKSQAADEALAHAIVQPLVNGLPDASATPGKHPAPVSDTTLPRRPKPRRKPGNP